MRACLALRQLYCRPGYSCEPTVQLSSSRGLRLGWQNLSVFVQGPVGVSNKHVETAIDEGSGKLTMLYQVSLTACVKLRVAATEGQYEQEGFC